MHINVDKAIQFVELNGNAFQKNFLKCVLGGDYLEDALKELAYYQNPDGGWIRLDPDYVGDISSITCTMAAFSRIERLNVKSCSLIDTTMNYLNMVQKKNGMWDEPRKIVTFDIPKWYCPQIKENQIWFTNGTLRYIISRKSEEIEVIKKARSYLRTFWDGQKFPGYEHNNWMGIVSFANSNDENDEEIYKGCLKNLRENMSTYDLADILWALESCALLKLPDTEEAVQIAIENIIKGQLDDGSFATAYGDEQKVDLAIEALDSLANYGVIVRKYKK